MGLSWGRTTRRFSPLSIVPVAAGMMLALGVPGASGQARREASASAAAASWSFQPMPSRAHQLNFINAISCSSARSCMAVGTSNPSTDITRALAEHWNGARWSILPTPRIPDTLATTVFNAVSCPGQNFCLAVGYFDRNRTLYPLGERWNGHRWSLALPSNQGGAFPAQLEGVSCPSARACVAVGFGGARAPVEVVERWNGHGWAASTSRSFPDGSTWAAVSCVSADACMAIAGDWAGSFNGRRWSVRRIPGIPSRPRGGPAGAALRAISCASAKSCMAVGEAGPYQSQQPLAAYWNGRRWTKESVPLPPQPPAQPTSCVPNGGCFPGQSYQYTSPAGLTGVSCLAGAGCEAIGSAMYTQHEVPATMVSHWNGTSWSTPAPPSTPRFLVFSVIACVRGEVCETAGGSQTQRDSTLEAARYG